MLSKIIGHESLKEKLEARLRQNAPGTYLFYGPPSVGKRSLAFEASKSILCENKKGEDCICNSCKRFDTKHPDFMCVGRREKIKIDDIDQILDFVETAPFISDHKIVVIDNAHDITWEAANKLLKILEEPPDNFTFFLISPYPGSIIGTVLSRCLKYEFSCLSREDLTNIIREKLGFELKEAQILGWLAMDSSMDIFSKAGHYLRYRNMAFDFISNIRKKDLVDSLDYFDKIDKEDFPIFSDLIILTLSDMLLLKNNIQDIANSDLIEDLLKTVKDINQRALMVIIDVFNQSRSMKFNHNLGLKNALIKSYDLFKI